MWFYADSKYGLSLKGAPARKGCKSANGTFVVAPQKRKLIPLFWLAVWPQRWTWLAGWQWKTGGERWHSDPISWQPFHSAGISCLPEQITPGILTVSPESVLTADLTEKGLFYENSSVTKLIHINADGSVRIQPRGVEPGTHPWIFTEHGHFILKILYKRLWAMENIFFSTFFFF